MHPVTIRFLLRQGANLSSLPHEVCQGDSAAEDRAYRDELETSSVLSSLKANAIGEGGMAPFHLTAQHSHGDSMVMLLEHGVNVKTKDSKSQTPIQYLYGTTANDHTVTHSCSKDHGGWRD